MREIRIHGRGGQGVVAAAEILITALVMEGRYAAGFPFFGAERRGAPVKAFVRFDDNPIKEKTQVYSPDCVIVMDSRRIESPDVFSGLKPNATLIANNRQDFTFQGQAELKIAGIVDASKIALEEIGIPVPNTCMAGAFAATTGWVNIDSVLGAIRGFFKGPHLDGNLNCALRGFESTQIRHLETEYSFIRGNLKKRRKEIESQ